MPGAGRGGLRLRIGSDHDTTIGWRDDVIRSDRRLPLRIAEEKDEKRGEDEQHEGDREGAQDIRDAGENRAARDERPPSGVDSHCQIVTSRENTKGPVNAGPFPRSAVAWQTDIHADRARRQTVRRRQGYA